MRKVPPIDRLGHLIIVLGIPGACVFSIANGDANQWTWLSLVSVLWYLKGDSGYAEAIRAISRGLAARLSSHPGNK